MRMRAREGAQLAFALLCDLVRNSCDLLESTCVASTANQEIVEIIGSAPQQLENAANLVLQG